MRIKIFDFLKLRIRSFGIMGFMCLLLIIKLEERDVIFLVSWGFRVYCFFFDCVFC